MVTARIIEGQLRNYNDNIRSADFYILNSNCPGAVFALSILGSWSFLAAIGAPAPLCFYPLWAVPASPLLCRVAAPVPRARAFRPFAPGFLTVRAGVAGAPLLRRRQQLI